MISTSPTRGMAGRHARVARTRTIEMGLQAVRARSVLKRADSGVPLTQQDAAELSSVRSVLDEAQSALRDGVITRGHQSDSRQLTSVGLALITVSDTQPVDKVALLEVIESLVADIDCVIAGQPVENGDALRRFVDGLLRSADASTSSTGESLTRPQP